MKRTDEAIERHVIWSNVHLDLDDWRGFLTESYPELSGNEDRLYEKMHEVNMEYLNDERQNLNIQLSRPILVIGDLGFWNGRVRCCKDAIHHDGTNRYLYRVFKRGVSDVQMARLQEKICCGKATRTDITRLTQRLGDSIAAVYGFQIPKQRTRQYDAR